MLSGPPNIGPSYAVDDGPPDHYGTMNSPPSAIGDPPPDNSSDSIISNWQSMNWPTWVIQLVSLYEQD